MASENVPSKNVLMQTVKMQPQQFSFLVAARVHTKMAFIDLDLRLEYWLCIVLCQLES